MTYRLKGASGDMTGQTFELEDDTLIGSDPEAQIRSEAFLPRHARIVLEDKRLMLESAGQTWVNGEPAGRQPLQSGDELRFNRIRFVLQAPGLKPARVLDQAAVRRGRSRWLLAALPLAAALAMIAWWVFNRAAG
ncbi:MAG: FHA domain-containing protein [Pseudomonadota bacterium]